MKSAAEKIQAARDAAMKALAARDLTRAELYELLVQKRHATRVVDAALLELEALGVVDDRRVASVYVQRRLETDQPTRGVLETELMDRGLDEGLIKSILDDSVSGRDEERDALDIARERVRRSRPDLAPDVIRRRVYAFLLRRGYDEEVSRQAVETAADEYLGRP
jgi:SOS response regulatory protein OraA/RecX